MIMTLIFVQTAVDGEGANYCGWLQCATYSLAFAKLNQCRGSLQKNLDVFWHFGNVNAVLASVE